MSERCETTLRVDPGHPALPGHFPGMPVVPGVVVLDLVLQAAERHSGAHLPVTGLSQAKFAAPLLPGMDARAVIHIEQNRVRFEVDQSGRIIALGCFTLATTRDT
jgi:3-hydroxymyristoyl/3-hydroxydecanoyl-(acyl carrier protein) dehydratase